MAKTKKKVVAKRKPVAKKRLVTHRESMTSKNAMAKKKVKMHKNIWASKEKIANKETALLDKRSRLPISRISLYILTGILVGGIIGIVVTVPGEGNNLIIGISLLGAIVGGLLAGVYTIAMEQFKWE